MKDKRLAINVTGKQKLSKSQLAFNKLTQKIERLQKDIQKKQIQFDLALTLFNTEVYKTDAELGKIKRELITALWDNYRLQKLNKGDQRTLKLIIKNQLDDLLTNYEVEGDEKFEIIFEDIEGTPIKVIIEDESRQIREAYIEKLKDLKVDISGLDLEDENELIKKLNEAQQFRHQKMYEQKEADYRNEAKKKSAKQIAAELLKQEEEDLKKKNIGTIYKQLAKLFHPDLEQDEALKVEKEILMKELTAAYEAKDLHGLLLLELKWIHKENEHLEKLTEEKLAVYMQILNDQVQQLEVEKEELFFHQRYSLLVDVFGWEVKKYPVQTVQNHIFFLKEIVEHHKASVNDCISPYALRHIKKMVKEWREMEA